MPNFCENCGNKLNPKWEYCKKCGQKVFPQQNSELKKELQRYRVPKEGLGKVKVTSTSTTDFRRNAIIVIFISLGLSLFITSMVALALFRAGTLVTLEAFISVSLWIFGPCVLIGILILCYDEMLS